MHRQFTLYVIPMVLAAAISAGLALFAWRRRSVVGAMPFCILVLAIAEWALGYALELAGADLSTKLFFINLPAEGEEIHVNQ